MRYLSILLCLVIVSCTVDDGNLPTNDIVYNNPTEVIINGYSDHAMEPFLSPDGQTLFYNSQNTGINTKLFYASRINDTEFEYEGEVEGANEDQTNQLNAVPDLDETNQFYWTSVRDYPNKLDNLHVGTYASGAVTDVERLQGDFYVGQPGWLVMDHGISFDGQTLYYNNARFNEQECDGPCETFLGVAKKETNGTFNKTSDSDSILAQINDVNFIYYAPCITKDGLELYYTRYKAGNVTILTAVEVCVSTRSTNAEAFGAPSVLFSSNPTNIVEAPTLSADKSIMYYHQKIGDNHKIFVRTRK